MAGKSASIKVNILGDDSSLRRSLNSAADQVDGFSKKMQGVGGQLRDAGQAMSMSMTLPIVAGLGLGVKWAGQLEDSQALSREVFGSMAADMDAWATNAAKAFGLAKGEAIEAANQIGLRLRSIGGLTEAEASKWAQTLTQLGGDLASAFGGSTQEAVDSINSALTGEFEPMKKYGVVINDLALKNELLALTGEEVTGTLTAQQKQQATLSLIMKQTGIVQGDYARNADGATNAQRTMTAQLKDAATTMGTVLLPYVTKAVQFITDLATRFQALSPTVQRIIVIMALVAAAIGPVVYIIGALVTAIGFIATPVGLVVAAIAALAAAFVYFYKTNEGFREWVQGVVTAVRDWLGQAFEWVRTTVIPALGRAFEWVQTNVFPKIIQAIEAVKPVITDLGVFFQALGDRVARIASWIWRNLDDAARIVAAVFQWLQPIISVVWETIKTQVQAAIQIVRSVIQTVTAAIRGDWSGVWNGIRNILAGVWNGIRGLVTGAVNAVRVVISGAWNAVRSLTSSAFGAVRSAISGAMNGALGIVRGIVGNITGLFGSLVGAAGRALGGLASALSAPFRAAGEAVRRAWNSAIGGKGISIPDWIPGIGGRRFEFPRLHSGGYAGGLKANEVPVILEAGESVRTRRQEAALQDILAQASSLGGSGGGQVHVHFHGPVAQDSVKWVTDQVEEAVRKGHSMPRLKAAVR